jgi:hypothetical protein
MYDVFYTGTKPGLFLHEQQAENFLEAAAHSRTKFFWFINGDNDYTDFDFNWVPDIWEREFFHIFPDQWCRNSETYFINVDAIDKRTLHYNSAMQVQRLIEPLGWTIPLEVKMHTVDLSWHPDPMDPPYIYHFPSKWQRSSGVTYRPPGADHNAPIKFVDPFIVEHVPSGDNWDLPDDIDQSSIDFSWRPDAQNVELNYMFPSEHNRASGVQYKVPGAVKTMLVRPFEVKFLPSEENWVVPININKETVNFRWRPDAWDPPYIYKFASPWARDSGLEYHVPGATEVKFVNDLSISFDAEALPRYYIETTIEDLIAEHQGEIFWALSKEMDYDTFDFSWHPDNSQRNFLHVFGSQWQKHASTYYVDTTSIVLESLECTYVTNLTVTANSSIDIFYVDKSNMGADERYKELCKKYDNITRLRYVKSMYDTIKRASRKATTDRLWIISSENDYTDFNFDWHAEPWQDYMLHVFGTDEQKWSDTYLINKYVFDNQSQWCKELTDIPDLHFVEDQKVKAVNVNDIYLVDFGQHNKLKTIQHNKLKTTRFVDSYLSVIKRIVAQATSEYIWVCSNICDYSNFNFDWRPEPYQAKMLHVFGTGENKFGDTFLVHVPTFKEQADKLKLLEWYETVNYCGEQLVPRLPFDVVEYEGDDLTSVIKEHKFDTPYALFWPKGQETDIIYFNPSLWRQEDRAIHTFTESGSVVLAPRDTLQYLDTQCYDYPYIMRQQAHFLTEKPLDIVYISNGEPTADRLYAHLTNVTKHDSTLHVHRIDGVNGRAEAYKAAAEISNTDWFLTVFAKLEVDPDFDWHWQPDRLQEPKHYIFNALNPVNGLEYGHQAMIAYNKKLVLETDDWGLDFTLSRAHESVPLNSGIAHYNEDPLITWRTAFREMIKLLADDTEISKARAQQWLQPSDALNSDMSVKGAQDAVEYFNEVQGDMEKLLYSFEWDWLAKFYSDRANHR